MKSYFDVLLSRITKHGFYFTLQANAFINCEKIRARVIGRLVFLEGTVHFKKERISAQKCIRYVFGIRAVINYLTYHNEYAQ